MRKPLRLRELVFLKHFYAVVCMKDNCTKKYLSKAIDCTLSHTFIILMNLKNSGIINIYKKKRKINKLTLTDKGKILQKEFINLLSFFGDIKK